MTKRSYDWRLVNWKKRNIEIAAELGCFVEVVCAARRRFGNWGMVKRRSQSEGEKERAAGWHSKAELRKKNIVSLFQEGVTPNEIAVKLDITLYHARYVLRKAGFNMERDTSNNHFIKKDERELIKRGAERVKDGVVSRSTEAQRIAPQIGRSVAAVEREMYRINKGKH